jgi:rubrerythrin
MKWLAKPKEDMPWLMDFICPVCGHIAGEEDDDHCSHCGVELEGWEKM